MGRASRRKRERREARARGERFVDDRRGGPRRRGLSPEPPTPAQQEKLRELGYLSGPNEVPLLRAQWGQGGVHHVLGPTQHTEGYYTVCHTEGDGTPTMVEDEPTCEKCLALTEREIAWARMSRMLVNNSVLSHRVKSASEESGA